ncbi:alpha/beta hydrolase [Sphingomonas sp. MA1305]|uniref:alpha/beta fold hydrolase n=1 Tax=Sphingomonas sp. MA1305 TaxID=2479204 RepID=UPI0018DF88B6|nr:alpha/beta hydrolase [Sphingomonas sp. MA1305]MBI0473956.1 alpha/beta hydrolase [Sphingomonas sp. MA1305]
MMSHLPLRIAASLLTLGVVLHPAAGHGQTAATAGGATHLPHISVRSAGTGSPVLLIPGLSSPAAVWDASVAQLAPHHRVITVQVNGFAGDAPGANLSPGILAGVVADLHGYLAAQKLAGVPVVGHSMGGLLAMQFALAHPGDVGRIMIVDSLPFYGRLFGPTMTPAMIEPRAKMMREAMAARYGKPADPAATAALANQMALKPESRAKVTAWVGQADARVGAQAMYEDLTTDLTADLPKLRAPVTLVVPYNAMLPQAQVDALYRGAYAGTPTLSVVEIGDAAHFVMLDQPEAFAKALDDFLR